MNEIDLLNQAFTKQVTLDVPTHKYYDEEKELYTSVTTVLGKYEKPFDKEYWAVWTTLKEKLKIPNLKPLPEKRQIYIYGVPFTMEQLYEDKSLRLESRRLGLEKQWIKITKDSCNRGNETHNFLEDGTNALYKEESRVVHDDFSLKGNNNFNIKYKVLDLVELESSPIKRKYPQIYQLMLDLISKGYVLFAEFRVYYYEYLLAGTIDLLALKDKRFIIIDWKTNKDPLQFTSGYYKKIKKVIDGREQWVKSEIWVEKDDRFLAPIQHLPKCKGVTYSLQLSTYAWILEQYGFTWLKSILVHIRRTPEKDYEPKFYDLQYYKNDVSLILKHYDNSRLENNAKISDK